MRFLFGTPKFTYALYENKELYSENLLGFIADRRV